MTVAAETIRRWRRTVFRLTLMVAILIEVADVHAQDQTQSPSFAEGDSWLFRVTVLSKSLGSSTNLIDDGIYQVAYSQGRFSAWKLTGEQKEELPSSYRGPIFAWVGRKENRDIRFPLFIGQKWDYRYERRAVGARRSLQSTVTIEVTGTEEITTTAGTFLTYKLEKDDRTNAQEIWTTINYYSAATKSIVKQLHDGRGSLSVGYQRSVELVKFGTGK